MKFTLATVALLAASANAFAPSPTFGVRSSSLFATRVDSSGLIKDAMEASKKFGAASPEARIAWEAVEEMDSSDNSEASKKNADGECDLEGAASIACMEYSKKLDELEAAIKMQKPMLDNMTKMASEIRAVKVGIPVITKSVSSPELKAALAAAQAVSTAKGATSPEAKIAWENVEEIAAASSRSGDMPALLTEECLVDAAREACEAIDELNRVLMLSKSDGDYRS